MSSACVARSHGALAGQDPDDTGTNCYPSSLLYIHVGPVIISTHLTLNRALTRMALSTAGRYGGRLFIYPQHRQPTRRH